MRPSHTNAKFAHGPSVVEWLNLKNIVPSDESLKKRLKTWEAGGAADIYAIDRVLLNTCYGLWELPEDIWMTSRSERSGDPRSARYPELQDPKWLIRRYVKLGWTTGRMAQELGCNRNAVLAALARNGIKVERRSTYGQVAA